MHLAFFLSRAATRSAPNQADRMRPIIEALRLARKPSLLARYRARLAANRATYPLFDITHALDDLLQAAWENRSSPMSSSIAS